MIRRAFVGTVLTVALSLYAGRADAIRLLDGFGGPVGYGNDSLPGNDDGSTSRIDVASSFPSGLHFFTGTYTSLFLNNNGNITFNQGLSAYTPGAFPIASQPMIAPWWADVDTRGPGFPDANGVFWHVERGRFVATWHDVGYFSIQDDKKNDFQLILTDRSDHAPGDFDVEFRYNRCEWTTGSASGGMNGFGGTPAQAGFDAGNTRDFFALPGSRTMGILDVCRTSNVGEPGRWVFAIRSGMVEPPDDGGFSEHDGGTSLLLEGRAGPCFCTIPGADRRGRTAAGLASAALVLGVTATRRRRRSRS